MPLHAHSDVFAAIANPGRRAILDQLCGGERPVLALAEPFDMSLPAVSQQLRILRKAGLVSERRDGRQRLYRLNPEPLREVRDWMRHYEKFWTTKLRGLGEYLDRTERRPRKRGKDGRTH
jgi:DNA-binding transcriptional ArsR family regulator